MFNHGHIPWEGILPVLCAMMTELSPDHADYE